MNWSNQAETMTRAWVDAQKKLWEDWSGYINNMPNSVPFDGSMADQWSEVAAQSYEAWAANADPMAKATAQKMLEGQQATLRFMDFSSKMWQDIAAKMQSGESWQDALNEYSEQLQQHYTQSLEAMSHINQDSNKLWELYLEQMQAMVGPLMKQWQAGPSFFTEVQNGQSPDFSKLTQIYWDLYQQTFGEYLSSPTIGSTRELEAKMRQGFDVWLRYRKAEAEYYVVVGEAWLKAFDQFREKLVSLSETGEAITSLAELGAVWTDVAETAFGEVFGSEKYILAQGNYLNSTMALRIEQRKMLEMVMVQFDMPTRTEIDQAHKLNHQLRKEVKALKKAMAATEKAEKSDSDALAEANKAIKTIQKENRELKKTVAALEKAQADTSAQKEVTATIKEMQKEIEALKKTAASAEKPKTPPKKRTTRTTAKKKPPAKPAATDSKEGGA